MGAPALDDGRHRRTRPDGDEQSHQLHLYRQRSLAEPGQRRPDQIRGGIASAVCSKAPPRSSIIPACSSGKSPTKATGKTCSKARRMRYAAFDPSRPRNFTWHRAGNLPMELWDHHYPYFTNPGEYGRRADKPVMYGEMASVPGLSSSRPTGTRARSNTTGAARWASCGTRSTPARRRIWAATFIPARRSSPPKNEAQWLRGRDSQQAPERRAVASPQNQRDAVR